MVYDFHTVSNFVDVNCDIFYSHVFDYYLALGILRLPDGLDYSRFGKVTEIIECMTENKKKSLGIINKSFVVTDFAKSDSFVSTLSNGNNSIIDTLKLKKKFPKTCQIKA
jgi:hypothetical protein